LTRFSPTAPHGWDRSLRDCSLEMVAKKYLDVELDKSWRTSFDHGWGITPEQINYAVNDVKVLSGIFEKQKKKLKDKGLVGRGGS